MESLQEYVIVSVCKCIRKLKKAEFIQQPIADNKNIIPEDQSFKNINVEEALKKSYNQLELELQRKYPFQVFALIGHDSIPEDVVFYQEAELTKKFTSIKSRLQDEFVKLCKTDEEEEIKFFKNTLDNKLYPLLDSYLKHNKQQRQRALDRAKEITQTLVNDYKSTMQTKIKLLPNLDSGTLLHLHNREVEEILKKFRLIPLGTSEFNIQWSNDLVFQLESEFQILQGNLESTLEESMLLITQLVQEYEKELTASMTETQNEETIAFHKKKVISVVKKFMSNCPMKTNHTKYFIFEKRLKEKLEDVYKTAVDNCTLQAIEIQENLEQMLSKILKEIKSKIDLHLEENVFFEEEEYEKTSTSILRFYRDKHEAYLAVNKIRNETLVIEREKFSLRTQKMINVWKQENSAREVAANSEADKFTKQEAEKYDIEMTKRVIIMKTYRELLDEHQKIKDWWVSRFDEHYPVKQNMLKEIYLTKLKASMENIVKKLAVNFINTAISAAIEKYRDTMEGHFDNKNQPRFFNEVELEKLHIDTKEKVTNFIILEYKEYELEKEHLMDIDTQQKLYDKLKEKNVIIKRSYGEDLAIGIELGLTYCCVAVYHMGKIIIVRNDSGNSTTPCYVTINKDGSDIVGTLSKEQAYRNREATIYDVKRIIGLGIDDPGLQAAKKFWPFKIEKTNNYTKIKAHDKYYCPEEISARLLKNLKQNAEKSLNMKIKKAVITVPAYFTQGQRQATLDAGKMAGLEVLGIFNEPAAAALAYRLDFYTQGKPKKVLVYDLGDCTFDVTILEICDDRIDNLSMAGDSHLGGQDFDKGLMEYCLEMFKKNCGIDLLAERNSEIKASRDLASLKIKRLQCYCEKARKALTLAHSTSLSIDAFDRGHDVNLDITRDIFEKRNEPLFKKTIDIVDAALKSANLLKVDIDDVILLGGSTRMVRIQTMLEEHFEGIPINNHINPEEAVAYGAAVQAAILNAKPSTTLCDFEPI